MFYPLPLRRKWHDVKSRRQWLNPPEMKVKTFLPESFVASSSASCNIKTSLRWFCCPISINWMKIFQGGRLQTMSQDFWSLTEHFWLFIVQEQRWKSDFELSSLKTFKAFFKKIFCQKWQTCHMILTPWDSPNSSTCRDSDLNFRDPLGRLGGSPLGKRSHD